MGAYWNSIRSAGYGGAVATSSQDNRASRAQRIRPIGLR